MRSLSLDPSINHVGWALLDHQEKTKQAAWEWGTFELEGANLQMRFMHLVECIQQSIGHFDFLITEKPTFFTSEKGQVAARQNYTIDLAACAFFVAGWFEMDHRHHFPITATQWKGSVSKLITARQFFKLWPLVETNAISEHAIDAVMLHRYWVQYYAQDLRPAVLGSEPRSLLRLI